MSISHRFNRTGLDDKVLVSHGRGIESRHGELCHELLYINLQLVDLGGVLDSEVEILQELARSGLNLQSNLNSSV